MTLKPRAVRPEVHNEAAVVPSIVRGCRNVVLSAHLAAADDAGQLDAGLHEARRERCDGLNKLPAPASLDSAPMVVKGTRMRPSAEARA